ncbi:MAG: T9SS type A sorting domain-containing protein [Bacteroidales bacterium]|nr:T9SS type A sorting domain-containing protein [Bacteroidales bacterium]MCF8345434.1 T9SS type A sorting domain-containing protein [Bacteroidales bacterium]MCF8351020.1 T9SS type A sorting domain-containing protein [Bacteroidales bacterium]
MKPKILLTVLMIGMTMGAFAQKPTMTLTFTADSNAQHLPLNSILIENLTQGGDTTLYAPDTVLVLDYITGMEEISTFSGKGFSLSQNYPNPMKGQTTVSLWLPERNNILITISDAIGREVVNQEFQLEQGSHSFTFYPGRESLYFLTVSAENQTRTIKMFNSPTDANVSGFCKLEYNGQQKTGTGVYKSGNALNNFAFDLGDMLKFTSFTDQGERVITSSPTDDQTYYFHYTGDPCPGTPTVTDIDGNVYNTVQIGNQCWMKENLKTKTYQNGTLIPNVTDPYEWRNLTSGAYVWYDNDISWKDKYGALYNWFTTVDPNGLCPAGWHVPTHDEWTVLTDYIGGTSSPHGNELKSCRQVNSPMGGGCNTSEHPRWNEHETHYGTDDYGFSGLPGGYRFTMVGFNYVGNYGGWWSSTEYSSLNAWYLYLFYSYGFVIVTASHERVGFSVRCLRN